MSLAMERVVSDQFDFVSKCACCQQSWQAERLKPAFHAECQRWPLRLRRSRVAGRNRYVQNISLDQRAYEYNKNSGYDYTSYLSVMDVWCNDVSFKLFSS